MYKKIFSAVLAALLLLCLLCGCQGGDNAVDSARSGVVRILVHHQDNSYQVASGFGLQVSKEQEAPSFFVSALSRATEAEAVYIIREDCTIHISEDGTLSGDQLNASDLILCQVLYSAPEDSPSLTVLKASEPIQDRIGLPLMHPGKDASTGDKVYVLGYGNTAADISGSTAGVVPTDGVLARFTDYNGTAIIEHTALTHAGNHGGPLVSENGAVVGVCNADLTKGDNSMYAAISADSLIPILEGQNMSYSTVDPANPYLTLYICLAAAGAAGVILVITWMGQRHRAAVQRSSTGRGNSRQQPAPPRSAPSKPAPNTPPRQSIPRTSAPRTSSQARPAQTRAPSQTYAPTRAPSQNRAPGPARTPMPAEPGYSARSVPPAPSSAPSAPRPAAPSSKAPKSEFTPIAPRSAEKQSIAPGFRFQGTCGLYANRRFAVNGTLRIGRDPARNDLLYPADAKGISDIHCVLTEAEDKLMIEDLASIFGTYVNGSRLAPNKPTELHIGDIIWLGYENEAFLIDRRT